MKNEDYIFSTERKFIDPIDLIKDMDTDAMKWAEAFMGKIAQGHFSRNSIDESLLVGWFASAIETAKDSIRHEDDIIQITQEDVFDEGDIDG